VTALRFSATVLGAAAVGIVLFVLGTIIGWSAANRLASNRAYISTMGEAHAFAGMAIAQHDNADADAIRAALDTYLRYLENPPSGYLEARMAAAEKAMTLGRLALLEERQHETAEADEFWSRAESEAKAAGWKDPSRKRIRDVIEQIDAPRQTRKPGP